MFAQNDAVNSLCEEFEGPAKFCTTKLAFLQSILPSLHGRSMLSFWTQTLGGNTEHTQTRDSGKSLLSSTIGHITTPGLTAQFTANVYTIY